MNFANDVEDLPTLYDLRQLSSITFGLLDIEYQDLTPLGCHFKNIVH